MKKNYNNSPPINWKKILLVGVVLAVAGYQWYTSNQNRPGDQPRDPAVATQQQPALDTSDWKLNNAPGNDSNKTAKTNRSVAPDSEGDFLVPIGGKNLQSPAGLIYGMGGGGEHRVEHVMRHATDQPGRPTHGVFEGDETEILEMIDEAYEMIKSKSKYVKSESSRGNTAYTISMGRQIGHEGGQKGKRSNQRSLRSLKLVLDNNKVITAYPVR